MKIMPHTQFLTLPADLINEFWFGSRSNEEGLKGLRRQYSIGVWKTPRGVEYIVKEWDEVILTTRVKQNAIDFCLELCPSFDVELIDKV